MHKITFTQHILRYFSSWARFLTKGFVLRPLPRLGSLLFTRTLTLALSFFFLSYLPLSSPVLQVSAQEPTATPFTPVPLFPSPTPQPTLDTTCPAGENPSGWGTVTPDVYWSLYCGSCVTPISVTGTPEPVSTFMIPLTQTAQASVTPSVVPSASPTVTATVPASTLVFTSQTLVSTGSVYFNDAAEFPRTWGISMTASLINTSGYIGVRDASTSRVDTRLVDRQISYSGSGFLYYDVKFVESHPNATLNFVRLYITQTGASAITIDLLNNPSGEVFLNGSGVIYYRVQWTSQNPFMSYSVPAGEFTDNGSVFSTYPLLVTPTPEPTVTPITSFCSSVLPQSGGEDLSGQFQLPVPMLGAISCPVNFPGLVVPLYGVLGLPDFVVPSVHICLQEIDFGTLIYFGVPVEIDYLAFVVAVGLVISMFVRK